nr:hypothetical protein [Gammaproteobacteria bacterium]
MLKMAVKNAAGQGDFYSGVMLLAEQFTEFWHESLCDLADVRLIGT